MLSTDIPPPDLPSSSSEKSQLKSSDEIASDYNVDLCKSGLDDNIPHPNFSIRDYVFGTRGKDIKTHWPFSPKNLQLCLKHGVKDVLPPFQTLESVRNNPSIGKCAAEINLTNISTVKLSGSSHDHIKKLAPLDIDNTKSSGSLEDKEYPSTTTSASFSEAENLPASKKVERNTQNPAKKCRLIVRLSNVSEQKPNEDFFATETMASKVCPVCKTFSSSSNTTLNAHIDQCLSGESTVKWTTNSKVVKHRIKPRKTRMMVDIYETAQCCTLEDLDRRNGTNWASSNLGFPALDLDELCDEEKNNTNSLVNSEDDKNGDEEGAVYFDSNGTKLRILSKFTHLGSSNIAQDDCGPSKIVKGDKGSKTISSKKKKYLGQRHKVVKCPPRERSCSPIPSHSPEVNNGQEIEFPPEEDEREFLEQPLRPSDQMKSNGFGMIKQWVGSKRTGLKKKVNTEHESQHLDKTVRNLRVKSNLPSLSDKFIRRSRSFPSSSDATPLLSTESHKRKENLSSNPRDSENHVIAKNSINDGNKVHNVTENHASPESYKKMRSISPTINHGGKEFGSLRKTSLSHAIVSRGNKLKKLPESKKKLGRKHLDFKKKKKHKLHYMLGSDEEAVDRSAIHRQGNLMVENAAQIGKASRKSLMDRARSGSDEEAVGRSAIHRQENLMVGNAAQMEKAFRKPLMERARFLKNRKDNLMESREVEKNTNDTFVGGNIKEVENRDEFACEPTSGGEEAFIAAFSESLGSEFPILSRPSDAELGKDIIISDTHLLAEDNVNEEQGNYFADVDPIPIPGPPGSFLPSPGRMGSEELQGNSSLTTCRIISSEDEHDQVVDDSSDSPISATSFASNSVAARSDSVSLANLTSQSNGSIPFGDLSKVNSLSPETSPLRFKNSQPCCCSRKEGVSQSGNSLNFQESQLLRRRTMTSPTQEKQMGHDPNNKLYSFDLRSEAQEPERVVAANSPKFPSFGDCDSPSPSTPNPVLRLMGKNLMVVNKYETTINPQNVPTQSSIANRQTLNQTCSRPVGLSDGSRIHANFRAPEYSPNPSRIVLPNYGGSFTSSFECHEYAGGSKIMLDNPIRYEVEKVRNPVPQLKSKEIIVIDDSPENEENFAVGAANPFFSYQTRPYPLYGGSQVVQKVHSQTAPSKQTNENLVSWNCIPEGSSVLFPPNSLTASSPSTGLLRSSSYFSSGFTLPTTHFT